MLRTDRRDRRLRGKDDFIDTENAARTVLGGLATAIPKRRRQCRDDPHHQGRQGTAVKARTAAMISLKTAIVNAPPELREQLGRPVDR